MPQWILSDTHIRTLPDPTIEPGHQVIQLDRTRLGLNLAAILAPSAKIIRVSRGSLYIPHTADVDRRIAELIDILIDLRMQAPGLVQLSFTNE